MFLFVLYIQVHSMPKGGTLHVRLTFVLLLLKYFLSFKMTSIHSDLSMQSDVNNGILLEILTVFFIFCCLFPLFLDQKKRKKKESATKSPVLTCCIMHFEFICWKYFVKQQSQKFWYLVCFTIQSSFWIPYHYRFSMGIFKEQPIHLHSKWRKWKGILILSSQFSPCQNYIDNFEDTGDFLKFIVWKTVSSSTEQWVGAQMQQIKQVFQTG